MQKLLGAVPLFLTSLWVYASGSETGQAAGVPVEIVDVVYLVLFLILVFGMIAWFFVQVWRNEKRRTRDQ